MQDPGGELPGNNSAMAVPCVRPLAGRRVRSHPTQVLKCPRCDSPNTKFCYYNNYNLAQPRHFCKNCRRYWTKGGVLRNVPVGGGCRKNKRAKAPPLRNSDRRSKRAASNSSSDNSTVTNSGGAAAASSSAASKKIPHAEEALERFDQETLVQQILSMPDPAPLRLEETANCDAFAYPGGPENALSRLLLNGLASLDYGLLDWQTPPPQSLTNLGSLLSDGAASNSNPYGSGLIAGSSPAGLGFSDLQWMLQQPNMDEPCLQGRCCSSNSNAAAASEWPPSYHTEVPYEMANDLCGWGMAGLGDPDQKPLRLP